MTDLLVKTCGFALALVMSTAVIIGVATASWLVVKYVKWLSGVL